MTAAAPTPLFGERAFHIPDAHALVVGDVHVGLEAGFAASGVRVPSQTERMRERLARLVAKTAARRLIVLGDLKHRIPVSSRQEEEELPGFFHGLDCAIELVRGNHDVDLGALRDVTLHDAPGIRVGDVGLAHGHTWPADDVMQARTVVTSHNHPAVLLVDELGHRHKEPAWVRGAFTAAARGRYPALPPDARCVVMPAFNELVGGVAFNDPRGGRLLGPLFTNGYVAVASARVFTLEGVDLGTVDELRTLADDEAGD